MSKREILITPFGEMMDMIACSAIYNGNADEKVKLSFEEALKVN